MSVDCEECREEVLRRLDRIEVWAFGPTEQNGARGAIEELRHRVEAVQRSIWLTTGALVILQPLLISALVKWFV
ncbi:MAG TPA: hypothetical protein PLU30_26500 [Verrucomicrobiae bacterium]|nr:hypothetical protein [Verrucomicrobiae bacterium]